MMFRFLTLVAFLLLASAQPFMTMARANANTNTGAYEGGIAAYERADYQAAVAVFRPLSARGHAGAEFMLGVIYYYGRGVHQDRRKAAVWFYKAARQGNPGAQLAFGSLHIRGVGVIQDLVKAHMWLSIAARSEVAQVRAQAQTLRADAVVLMTPAEIARAQRRQGDWKPVAPGFLRESGGP